MAIFRGAGGSGDATTDAASQATVATTKAAEAATSASAASSSATTAATEASNASTSASNSETSKIAAVAAQAAAELAETNAETAQTAAETAQSAAELAETNAETAQTAAETAQTASESAETNAETAQTAAETAQAAAELAETNAETAETNAANSATAAATSANDAATSYDSFDDRYLGAKATPPTLDNDGDALLTGALYWNTGSNQLFVWAGSAWEEAAFSISGAVTSFNTRTGAVTLSSTDVTNVGALMDSELTSEASVKALDQGVATTDSPSFAGLTTTANINFGDNDRAIFGAGSDLQIYHNGANSYIDDTGTGNLYIRASDTVRLQSATGEQGVIVTTDGAVTLYHDNGAKLSTTSTGIDVTGTVVSDGLTVASGSTYGIDLSRVGAGNTTLRITGGSTAGNDAVLRADIANTTGSTGVYFGDSDTNGIGRIMYEHNGDYMRFYTSSTEKVRITSSGNVGIGTTSPTVKLHVSSTGTPIFRIQDADGSDYYAQISQATGNTIFDTRFGASNGAFIFRGLGGGTADEYMRITSTGNVGIGTTSPDRTLSIKGSSTTNIPLTVESGSAQTTSFIAIRDPNTTSPYAVAVGSNTDDLLLRAGGAERMRITSAVDLVLKAGGNTSITIDKDNGNVGIGTTSPLTKLVTVGTTMATSQAFVGSVADTSYSGGIVNLSNSSRSIGITSDPTDAGSNSILNFSVDGSERMRINGSGNVGIGTTSPTSKLEVLHNTDINMNASGTGHLEIDGNAYNFAIALNSSGANLYTNSVSRDLIFGVNETEVMRVTDSNVGIGTGSPASLLHLSSGSPRITLTDTGTGADHRINADSSAGNLGFEVDYNSDTTNPAVVFTIKGSEKLRIDSSGNLKFNSGYGSAATAYGCRAWVNFNGEGTVSIRDSGNVTSITDNGTGIYRVNFTTSMPDANYSTLVTCEQAEFAGMGSATTSSVTVYCVRRNDTLSRTDNEFMNVAVFR